jgi:glycosyltransferase involved in cell wall biosynthesis
MKIAILGTRGIPAHYGGFETFAEKLAVGLCERGYDVTVFCESGESSLPKSFRGVSLRYASAAPRGPLGTILYDLRSLWAARKKYDVVYMLGYGAAPFCLIPRLWGAEVWINPDGLEWARAKWGTVAKTYFRLMEWSSIHAANRIIADAEAIRESLSSRHGRIDECTVIAYGCDLVETPPSPEQLTEWQIEPGGYYLVVCRLEPENHVLEILRAFQRSRSQRKLVVVGNHFSGTRYVSLLRAIEDPRIQMIGTVFDEAKLTCLRYHSFAYMHGHSVGGTNPSLLEAMGCRNLIFAHDNPFNRETLGASGIFFADEQELTSKIDNAEEGSIDLDRLRLDSMSRARLNYRWDDIVSKYAALLGRITDKSGLS